MVCYVKELLFRHDCVIVPGLGAFIGNYQPARVKLYESRIYPPGKAIAFNRALKNNDGLLIAYTAQSENISYKQAEEKVNVFVADCMAVLEKNKSYLFTDIGRLFYDNNNNLLFEPADTVNFLTNTYGMPVITIEPVERLKTSIEDTRPKIENDQDVEILLAEIEATQQEKNKRSSAPYWVSFVLAIGLISSVVGISLHQGNFSNISRSSLFPDFDSLMNKTEKTEQPVVPAIRETPVVVPVAPAPAEAIIPAAEVKVTSSTPEPVKETKKIAKAYIVVGAFFDQQYADKTKAEASEKGYHTVQVDDYDGSLHRVLVESDVEAVHEDLGEIKSSMNARAWIYCMYCSH